MKLSKHICIIPSMSSKSNIFSLVGLLLDLLLTLSILILTLPLLVILSICIKLTSPGPIFFSQQRLGKNLKPFKVYKFRTMYHDSKKKFPELYNYNFTKKQILTKGIKPIIIDPLNDPRLTPTGKFMRKNSLDELPNLFNVLKGEMSIVGPRPEPIQMLRYYTKKQRLAFSVKPGITGLAQINGRGLLSLQQTINYDVEYAKTKSLSLDLAILLKTLKVVVKQTGAF